MLTISWSLQFKVFKECQDSWKAIIIDEFQDTSAMQYSLLKILAFHNCITIVGDDDQVHLYKLSMIYQRSWSVLLLSKLFLSLMPYTLLQSIFSFNGADVSGFDSFRKDFPNHKEVVSLIFLICSTFRNLNDSCGMKFCYICHLLLCRCRFLSLMYALWFRLDLLGTIGPLAVLLRLHLHLYSIIWSDAS